MGAQEAEEGQNHGPENQKTERVSELGNTDK